MVTSDGGMEARWCGRSSQRLLQPLPHQGPQLAESAGTSCSTVPQPAGHWIAKEMPADVAAAHPSVGHLKGINNSLQPSPDTPGPSPAGRYSGSVALQPHAQPKLAWMAGKLRPTSLSARLLLSPGAAPETLAPSPPAPHFIPTPAASSHQGPACLCSCCGQIKCT